MRTENKNSHANITVRRYRVDSNKLGLQINSS